MLRRGNHSCIWRDRPRLFSPKRPAIRFNFAALSLPERTRAWCNLLIRSPLHPPPLSSWESCRTKELLAQSRCLRALFSRIFLRLRNLLLIKCWYKITLIQLNKIRGLRLESRDVKSSVAPLNFRSASFVGVFAVFFGEREGASLSGFSAVKIWLRASSFRSRLVGFLFFFSFLFTSRTKLARELLREGKTRAAPLDIPSHRTAWLISLADYSINLLFNLLWYLCAPDIHSSGLPW